MSAHIPVMMTEVLEALSPASGKVYVDGTFGAGGYTKAILEAADCRVIAIDRDPSAQETAEKFSKIYGPRFIFLRGCFGDVETLLAAACVRGVDGFVMDIGVSSMQIDQAERGFSFRTDGPLDMRMDTASGVTAAEIVNTYDADDLANVIYLYGEERYSRRVARKIVTLRAEKPFSRTLELAEAVRSAVPHNPKDKIDPATRTFQALRIAVNDELGELERALASAERILTVDGRLVVVTFHSLEDRIVKNFMKEKSEAPSQGSRYLPGQAISFHPTYKLLSRKALSASAREAAENSRARSAKLRSAVRV